MDTLPLFYRYECGVGIIPPPPKNGQEEECEQDEIARQCPNCFAWNVFRHGSLNLEDRKQQVTDGMAETATD